MLWSVAFVIFWCNFFVNYFFIWLCSNISLRFIVLLYLNESCVSYRICHIVAKRVSVQQWGWFEMIWWTIYIRWGITDFRSSLALSKHLILDLFFNRRTWNSMKIWQFSHFACIFFLPNQEVVTSLILHKTI